MAKVSVVIPTYNREEAVERAIDSALAQTLSAVEVIVVDDASTDGTQSVLESYGDRIEYYTHDENTGGSAARNTGIEVASGDYLAFLDSDDEWEPTKLEKQVELLDERGDEWVAAYCDFTQKRDSKIVETIDNIARRPTGIEGDEELIDRIFLRSFAHGGSSTLLVRSDTVAEICGFDERFERHQDLEFLVRVLQEGKMGYVDEVLVTKHDTGRTSSDVARRAGTHLNEKFETLLVERGLLDDARAVQNFIVSKLYFREGEFRAGIESLRSAKMPHYRDGLGLMVAILDGIHGNRSAS